MSKGEVIAPARKWRWLIRLVVIVVGVIVALFFQADPNYTACIGQKVDRARQIEACTHVIEHDAADRRSVAYVMRGNDWGRKADYDRAIADYDQAIELDPKNGKAFYNRGMAWGYKGDNDRAMADYDKAISLDPQIVDAYNNRGLVWVARGDNDRAIAEYDQALGLDPKHAISYYNRGIAWARKGDVDRAMADYNQAISLDPKMVDAYNHRGSAWAGKGDYDRAIADYDQAISLDPKDADAYFDRGIVSFYSGALAKARADFEQTAMFTPGNAYAAIWLDLANRRSGMGSHLQGWIGRVDMTKWPAPVVRMLLGEQTPADTLKAADDPDATTKTGQVCEANFYTAELSRLQGPNDEALQLYRAAVSGCPKGFYEYQAAKAALRELGVSL